LALLLVSFSKTVSIFKFSKYKDKQRDLKQGLGPSFSIDLLRKKSLDFEAISGLAFLSYL
jgi:hypothetical protein